MNIESRLKLLEDVDEFINDKTKMLTNILCKLGWPEESLAHETKVQCPENSEHWISKSTLSEHAELCAWTKKGYLKDEKEKQPPSSSFFYENATSVVPFIIDKKTLARIISENRGVSEKVSDEAIPDMPFTVDQCTVEMTPEQRLAVYDYVVSACKALNKPSNVKMEDLLFDFEKKNEDGGKPKTELELLAEQRDYKRRRQSYRAKNVHITKKSYTEVMKEVIENQITYLAESRKQEDSERNVEDGEIFEDRMASTISKRGSDDTEMYDTKDNSHYHRSRRSRSKSKSQERSRHKRKKSRSRSKSRHKHKKSHKKHKKSH